MSTKSVVVREIDSVCAHPDAERLDVATIGGWQVVVPKGRYVSGEPVVYFEPDTVLPRVWAEKFNVTTYLAERSDIHGDRVLVVRSVRLRGEPSFGLVVPPAKGDAIGDDVSERYGATKFMPPVKVSAGDAERDNPRFPAYTDIQNMRSFADVIPVGMQVVGTEKIHGSSCRVAIVHVDGVPVRMAGSRTLRRKQPENYAASTYWKPFLDEGVVSLLETLSAHGDDVVLYGEVFGKGVQSYTYGVNAQDFRAFDISINGRYVDSIEFQALCLAHCVPQVPVIYSGPYNLDVIALLADGESLVGGEQGREGVVVRPESELSDPRIGRVILKYVGNRYLFGDAAAQDTTDQ